MVTSNVFDLTVNAFADLVTEVFNGTDENQKAKLRRMLNHFTKISNFDSKRKPNSQNNNVQPKKPRLSVIHNILPPEILDEILKFLNYKEICQAKLVCRRWKEIIDNGNLSKKALARISCVFIAGGSLGTKSTVEVLPRNLGIKPLLNLQRTSCSSMVLHNGTILLCGGYQNENKCLQLDHGTWKQHSTLNEVRIAHSAVTTQTATFIFGGIIAGGNSSTTYEYLLKDSTTWLKGKTKIPEGFTNGCAIVVKSEQEIWLIGGLNTKKRILSFNVNDHTFQVLHSKLKLGRIGSRCAFIPNTNKVMITGGSAPGGSINYPDLTEILDTNSGRVTMACPLKYKRFGHGMGLITINEGDRLAVFGGSNGRSRLNCVELFDTHTKKWETTKMKLNEAKCSFSFINVKLSEIISKL